MLRDDVSCAARRRSRDVISGVGWCFLRFDTGVTLTGDVITVNHCLAPAEAKPCWKTVCGKRRHSDFMNFPEHFC